MEQQRVADRPRPPPARPSTASWSATTRPRAPLKAPAFRGWVDDVTLGPKAPDKPLAHLSDYAVTTRGTHSSGSFSRGNTFPATAVPHGFNFWTPVTNAGSTDWLYEYARKNNADNLPTLQAFSASHEPSPWMGDRQTFQVMPSAAAGTPDASRTRPAPCPSATPTRRRGRTTTG